MPHENMTFEEILLAMDDLMLDMVYIDQSIVNAKIEEERQEFLRSYAEAKGKRGCLFKSMILRSQSK